MTIGTDIQLSILIISKKRKNYPRTERTEHEGKPKKCLSYVRNDHFEWITANEMERYCRKRCMATLNLGWFLTGNDEIDRVRGTSDHMAVEDKRKRKLVTG